MKDDSSPMVSLPVRLLLCLAWAGSCAAASQIPESPADFVLDDAKVFSHEKVAELKKTLTSINTDLGVRCFVATFSSLEGGLKEQAFTVTNAWVGDEPGLLLIYSWGEGLPKVMASPAFWRRYPTDEVMVMMQRAAPMLNDANAPASQRLSKALEIYATDIRLMETKRQQRVRIFPSEERHFILSLAAVTAVCCLLGWLMTRWLGKKFARHETYFMPEVEVGKRLGAPYGGGSMAQSSARTSVSR